MYIFDILTKIFVGISITAVIVGLSFLAFFYYMKKHKPGRESESGASFTNLKRVDALNYVPFDDIREDVMVMDNYTRFIGAIVCKGFDFFSAHPAEQLVANQGYLEFVNSIDKPIQKRIYSRKVDLELPINRHKQAVEEYKRTLLTMYSEGAALEAQIKEAADDSERENLRELSKRLYWDVQRVEWKQKHLEHVGQYMENLSGEGASPVQEETYIFEWVFNPNDFPSDITKEEIFVRANKELEAKANQFKSSLKSSGVRTKRATNKELIDIVRRHFHPFGSDLFKMSDIENSNFDEMVVSSKSLEDARQRYYDAMLTEMKMVGGEPA